MHPDGNHTRCEVRESTYRWKKGAWSGQPSDSVCGFLLLSQAPGVLASLGSSLLLTSCHIHLKDCSRHDGMACSASLTLSQCEQGMEGALWSSLLSTAWLIPPVYAHMFVCLCAHLHIHVSVEAKGKPRVSSSGVSSPHCKTGSLLGLELTN